MTPRLFVLPTPRAYTPAPCTCSTDAYCGPCQDERTLLERLVTVQKVKH